MLSQSGLLLLVAIGYCASSVSQQPWNTYGHIHDKQVNENTINQNLEFDQDKSVSNGLHQEEIRPFLEEGENNTTGSGIVEDTSNTLNHCTLR